MDERRLFFGSTGVAIADAPIVVDGGSRQFCA
jgi:hypothetical protein